MKKFISFIVVLCLLISVVNIVFAADTSKVEKVEKNYTVKLSNVYIPDNLKNLKNVEKIDYRITIDKKRITKNRIRKVEDLKTKIFIVCKDKDGKILVSGYREYVLKLKRNKIDVGLRKFGKPPIIRLEEYEKIKQGYKRCPKEEFYFCSFWIKVFQIPTNTPTEAPTITPTNTPTEAPTNTPTNTPTDNPTNAPTDNPTVTPTEAPTDYTIIPIDNGGSGGSNVSGVSGKTLPRTGEGNNTLWIIFGIVLCLFGLGFGLYNKFILKKE